MAPLAGKISICTTPSLKMRSSFGTSRSTPPFTMKMAPLAGKMSICTTPSLKPSLKMCSFFGTTFGVSLKMSTSKLGGIVCRKAHQRINSEPESESGSESEENRKLIRVLGVCFCLRPIAQLMADYLERSYPEMVDQMLKCDEKINRLKGDLEGCTKELPVARGILPKVTEERDRMWKEVKQYSEKNMLLNSEVMSLKKRVEGLEEDLLLKEGQITILKDSLGKPFDLLSSSDHTEEFELE